MDMGEGREGREVVTRSGVVKIVEERREMHGKYDGAAVKQTGMLQNQYLLDTRRYSTLNASLVTQACTNTRMPLTLCPPLLCDTTASGCHVSPRGRNRDGNG